MGTAIRISISGRSASGFRAMRPRFGFAAAAERVRDDTGPLAAPFADARPRPSLRASSSVIRVTDFSFDLDDESRVEIPVLERVVGVLRRVAARVADYASSALHIVAGAVGVTVYPEACAAGEIGSARGREEM